MAACMAMNDVYIYRAIQRPLTVHTTIIPLHRCAWYIALVNVYLLYMYTHTFPHNRNTLADTFNLLEEICTFRRIFLLTHIFINSHLFNITIFTFSCTFGSRLGCPTDCRPLACHGPTKSSNYVNREYFSNFCPKF